MFDLSKYNRIFTFGCSYTLYQWPTWADILIYDTSIEGFNYALPGLGNVGIMHRLIEADIRHKFNENDCILICWSDWTREDRYLNGGWKRYGNVYNNDFYSKKFFKYCDRYNDIVKNSTAIINCNRLYGDKIIFQGSLTEIGDYIFDDNEKYEHLENFYYPEINISAKNIWTNFTNCGYYHQTDKHPTIESHLKYLEEILQYRCKESTIKYYLDMDGKIKNIIINNPKDFQGQIQDKIYQKKELGFS